MPGLHAQKSSRFSGMGVGGEGAWLPGNYPALQKATSVLKMQIGK